MKAPGPLAVAERHIFAPYGRSDRGRSDDYAHFVRRHRPSPFQSTRDKVGRTGRHNVERSVAGPTDCIPWRTERARRAWRDAPLAERGGTTREARSRRTQSRLSGLYPRGLCGERGYPAQRPRACRGLSSHYIDCGSSTLTAIERAEGFHPMTSTAVTTSTTSTTAVAEAVPTRNGPNLRSPVSQARSCARSTAATSESNPVAATR